jgi:hypothetical protein
MAIRVILKVLFANKCSLSIMVLEMEEMAAMAALEVVTTSMEMISISMKITRLTHTSQLKLLKQFWEE